MDELSLGDKVLTGSGKFEPIYSFGHKNQDATGDYVRVSVKQSNKQRLELELSPQHMLLVNSSRFVPASMVTMGDNVTVADNGVGTVEHITMVERPGLYAPFTPSGTLLVNGVVVSAYVALQESETLVVGGWSTPLTLHWLAHVFESPHRMACRAGLCKTETYTEDGVSRWVYQPLVFSEWMLGHGLAWLVLPLVAIFLPFWVVDSFLQSGWLVVAGMTTLALGVLTVHKFGLKIQAKQ